MLGVDLLVVFRCFTSFLCLLDCSFVVEYFVMKPCFSLLLGRSLNDFLSRIVDLQLYGNSLSVSWLFGLTHVIFPTVLVCPS